MKLLQFLTSANPIVSILVQLAELVFSAPKSGDSKKQFVHDAIATVAGNVPGLQADLDQVKAAVDPMIENAVSALNAAKKVVADVEKFVVEELNLG